MTTQGNRAVHNDVSALAWRWFRTIVTLFEADAGFIAISDSERGTIVAQHQIFIAPPNDTPILSGPFSGRNERILVLDATDRPDLHEILGPLALSSTGFFFRRSLNVEGRRIISLVLFGKTPRLDMTACELTIADEIIDNLAEEVERLYPAAQTGAAPNSSLRLNDVEDWVSATHLPAIVFDAHMQVKAANEKMLTALRLNSDNTIGHSLSSLQLPATGSIELLFRHAMATQIATPSMQLMVQDSASAFPPYVVNVKGSPLTSTDAGALLIATIDPSQGEDPYTTATELDEAGAGQNATAEFLLETLVQRRSLRNRNNVCYVTLRSWRQSIRAHQIRALKAIKRNAPKSIATEFAAEMRDDIMSLFGAGNFRAIVPVPCGHSTPGRCLSLAIAGALSRDLGLPVVKALALQPQKGSSHPKNNVKRPAMTLAAPVEGPVILIDDVATSGRHIEEATLLLRETGASVLAVAWIGGDSEHEKADEDLK